MTTGTNAVTIDGTTHHPPGWDEVARMDLPTVRKWMDISSTAMERLWDPEANEYRPGADAWGLVEDSCLMMVMRLS